jgi:Kef-type K+ transport system membrane component KefB
VHYLDESHILLFLLQVLALLGCARTLAVVCEELKIPSIAGEIVAGVLLGPTLFGRVAPEAQAWLFPVDQIQSTMLETVSWLGVFFLLLSSGFHVDVRHAVSSGRAAILIGIVGVLVPIGIGYPVFLLFDPALHGEAATELTFALFLAVAGSITAISVVARALNDLKLTKTHEGHLALSACAVNDVFGWFLFTVVMSLVAADVAEPLDLVWRSLGIVAFVVLTVVIGAQVLGVAVRLVKATSLTQPAAVQTLVVSAGLLCGAITQWLGIHAILGFFLAGTITGTASGVSKELRGSVSDTLNAIFVPLFFATLGLKIDFIVGLKLWPTVIFCLVAVGGKFIGAWLGARLGRLNPSTCTLMGLIFIPGGAMEIVVATLALELRLISQTTFVAIVFAALASSIVAGPLIGWWSRRTGIQENSRNSADQETEEEGEASRSL